MQFNQTPSWGSTSTCVISRTGDLLSKVWLNLKLPALNPALEIEDFIKIKNALGGDTFAQYNSDGLPDNKPGTHPYIHVWTKSMNKSKYLPTWDGLKWVEVFETTTPPSSGKLLVKSGTNINTATEELVSASSYITWTKYQADLVTSGFTGTIPDFDNGVKPFERKMGALNRNVFDNDLDLQREFIQSNPGHFPKARYCDEVGHAMIDKIDLVIGGTLIDSHPGHYLQVWNELTQTPEKKSIGHLIGRSGSEEELQDMAMAEQELFIPLQFFFNRHLMASLPLIALQYHQVEIKVTFKELADVVAFGGYKFVPDAAPLNTPERNQLELLHQAKGSHGSYADHYKVSNGKGMIQRREVREIKKSEYALSGVQLMCNLVYLEEEERKTFAGSTHEYLVDLLQYQGPQSASSGEHTTYHAYFNHPTSELIWTFVPKVSIDFGEPFNYTALQSAYNAAGDTMIQAKLQFNGYDRFGFMPASYFREIVPAQYHTSVPTRPVYVYSFALEPEDFRPSGSVNLSRIDNVKLITKHVNFAPQIIGAPVTANAQSENFNVPVTGTYDPAGLNAGVVNSNKKSVGHENVALLGAIRSMNADKAVAVHPDPNVSGTGLFLHQTDMFASDIIPGAELRVYARSKNVLRIKSGMAGLAYAN